MDDHVDVSDGQGVLRDACCVVVPPSFEFVVNDQQEVVKAV